jgi:ubiquinone/menaquinone biosynthesis C-methylase UbiE
MPAVLDRLFAAGYDRVLARSEERGLRDARAALVGRARGEVVELGAGTGLNLAHYDRTQVTRVVATEPDPHMAKQLRARADASFVEVVEAPAERLPVPDASADTVVSTLVLCTVRDPAAALAEVDRVLRPGGQLLLYEHVRAEDEGLARWQDRLERPWGWLAGGCHPNRDTLAALDQCPLVLLEVEQAEFPAAPGLVKPVVVGVAQKR